MSIIINKIYDFIYFLFIILINASMERSDILHLILLQFLYYFIPIIALLHYCIIALLHYCIIALLHYCIIANIFYIILSQFLHYCKYILFQFLYYFIPILALLQIYFILFYYNICQIMSKYIYK
jgi:hypothetical protein